MRLRARSAMSVWLCLVACSVGLAQTPVRGQITLEQFRELSRLMGLQASDLRDVHAQMKRQRTQVPSWWPESLLSEIETRMTAFDAVPVLYPAIAPCFTGTDADMLIALYKTPEGQTYQERLVGIHLETDGQDSRPAAEWQKQNAADQTHLPAAIRRLDPRSQRLARDYFGSSRGRKGFNCLSYGYLEYAPMVGFKRTLIAQQVINAHRDELKKDQEAYEAQHPNAPSQ